MKLFILNFLQIWEVIYELLSDICMYYLHIFVKVPDNEGPIISW